MFGMLTRVNAPELLQNYKVMTFNLITLTYVQDMKRIIFMVKGLNFVPPLPLVPTQAN